MSLIEINVGRLTGWDVGNRIVVTREGVAFDGTLAHIAFARSEYEFKDRPRLTCSITVKRLEIGAGTIARDKVLAEIKLAELPLDYIVQKDDVQPLADWEIELLNAGQERSSSRSDSSE